MVNENKRTFALLMMILILFVLLSASAAADCGEGQQMPYEIYALKEAIRPAIPPDPVLGDTDDVTADFNTWWQARSEQLSMVVPDLERIHSFTKDTTRLILSEEEANGLYSPINSWLYLELLASLTEGNSRTQIQDLLGRDPSNESDNLFDALYWDDGTLICRPAASLWIDSWTDVSEELLSKLASERHASVYQGPMGDEAYDDAFRAWLNEQTNDLLKDVVGDLGFDQETTISLCTTLYIRFLWDLPFPIEGTFTDMFHTATGDIQTDFMQKEQSEGIVYHGTAFSSVIMDLHRGGYVTLVLPESDSSVKALLQTEELFDFFLEGRSWSNSESGKVTIRMPRVDIFAETSMNDALIRLGVTDVFDPDKIAFTSGLTSDHDLTLTTIEQYARVIMNEAGTEAASIILSDVGALPQFEQNEIDFILDRPFLFAMFSETNIPLFIGLIYTP